ncbi:unnamed protein product [Penicillium glandicola]
MPSTSQHTTLLLSDGIQRMTLSDNEEQHGSAAVSVPTSSTATRLKFFLNPEPDVIDPFRALPWFAMEVVILGLPDLCTLHQLCQASPAVSDYLNHTPGFFPKVVEKLMEHSGREKGYHIDTQFFFRTLVYLWWKEESATTGLPSDGNPLPDDFYHPSFYAVNVSYDDWRDPEWIGKISLPSSTPPGPLRLLLSLASRIRRDAHAFFHGCMNLYLSSNLECLAKPKKPWAENGPRPRGLWARNDVVAKYGILSWLEEQRLMQAFIKPYLFKTLRRLVCEKKVLKTDSPCRDEAFPNALLFLKQGSVGEYWKNFDWDWKTSEAMEQMRTVIAWMREGRPLHLKLPKRPAPMKSFTTCCPKHCWMSEEQLKGVDTLQNRTLVGCFFAQNCPEWPQSGINEAGKLGRFRKYGSGCCIWGSPSPECTITFIAKMLPTGGRLCCCDAPEIRPRSSHKDDSPDRG